MTVLSFLSAALILLAALFGSIKAFQMLQQNSYVNSRYGEWLGGKFCGKTVVLKAVFLAFFSGLGLFLKNAQYVLTALSAVTAVTVFFRSRQVQKSAVKPLVFTMRVKRMIITESIISAAVFGLCFVPGAGIYGLIASGLVFVLRELVVPAVNFINRPVEKAVAKHYIRDAKRILRQSPNIITVGVTGS